MKTIEYVEEFSANCWPASGQILYDGWLLRFDQGYSRHNNCVWPFHVGTLSLEEKFDCCRDQYHARGSTCGFRLCGLPGHDEIQTMLAPRGYVESNPNLKITVIRRPCLNRSGCS